MSVNDGNLKIAVASHGLGLVTRGTEMWAKNLSYALKDKGADVSLYKGWGRPESDIEYVLSCIKRDSKLADNVVQLVPSFRWRIGCSSPDSIEATTFALSLTKEIIVKKFDIVHTADPQVARILVTMQKLKIIKTKIIFANAIPDEPLDFIRRYGFVQQRTPYYIEEAQRKGIDTTGWFAIPNFVDTEKFKPKTKAEARKTLEIPEDVFVVLCAATIDKSYKRIDYLITEMADFCFREKSKALLMLVGAERKDTKEIIQMSEDLLGDKVIILLNQPHNKMPDIYAAADIFVMCSINEVFGIAFIEAMSCRIPAIGHIYPPTRWIIGSGGDCIDMCKNGALSALLSKHLCDINYRTQKAKAAREEVLKRFSQDSVVKQIIEMYKKVGNNSYG